MSQSHSPTEKTPGKEVHPAYNKQSDGANEGEKLAREGQLLLQATSTGISEDLGGIWSNMVTNPGHTVVEFVEHSGVGIALTSVGMWAAERYLHVPLKLHEIVPLYMGTTLVSDATAKLGSAAPAFEAVRTNKSNMALAIQDSKRACASTALEALTAIPCFLPSGIALKERLQTPTLPYSGEQLIKVADDAFKLKDYGNAKIAYIQALRENRFGNHISDLAEADFNERVAQCFLKDHCNNRGKWTQELFDNVLGPKAKARKYHDEAIAIVKERMKEDPTSATDCLLNWGDWYSANKKWDRADNVIQMALQKRKEYITADVSDQTPLIRAMLKEANLAYDRGQTTTKANKLYSDLITHIEGTQGVKSPALIPAYIGKANCIAELGRWEEAHDWMKKAFDLGPDIEANDLMTVLRNLSSGKLKLHDPDLRKHLPCFGETKRQVAYNLEANHTNVDSAQVTKLYEDAEKFYTVARNKAADYNYDEKDVRRILEGLVKCKFKLGKDGEALEIINNIKTVNPKLAELISEPRLPSEIWPELTR